MVEKVAETLSQVAKSSSITAFLESLRDLEAASALVARDEGTLVEVLDTVLACAQKYERNVLVMARVVEFMKSFAEYPAIVHSGCFEQLDAFTEDLLDERAIAAQYLELVERLLRSKLDILDVSINSLQRIRRFHAADDLLTAQFYKTVAGFAGVLQGEKFVVHANFFEGAKEDLATFASNQAVVEAIFQSLEKMAGGSADCCLEAAHADIFRVMRQYARFYQKDVTVVDATVRAHMWAMWFLADFRVVQGEHDVVDELVELM